MTIFSNFKKQSQCFMTTFGVCFIINHSVESSLHQNKNAKIC